MTDRAGHSAAEPPTTSPSPGRDLPPGARVEVRNRFDGSWSAGFEVAEAVGEPAVYRVRRVTDDAVLNGTFRPDDLRREPHGRQP